MMKRRITPEERAELIDAIEKGEVDVNVTAYAEAYAAERGLNPNTVRSAITRLRKEVGAPERLRGGARVSRGPLALRSIRPDWFATTAAIVLTAADPSSVAKIGAAALVRYEHDEEFKRAVDVERADLEKIYVVVDDFHTVTQSLGDEGREAILNSLLHVSN